MCRLPDIVFSALKSSFFYCNRLSLFDKESFGLSLGEVNFEVFECSMKLLSAKTDAGQDKIDENLTLFSRRTFAQANEIFGYFSVDLFFRTCL